MTGDNKEQRLGIVVSGSLNKGLDVRLDGSSSIEDIAVGRYLAIEGKKQRYLAMLTDVTLGVTDERLSRTPPDTGDAFLAEVLSGTSTYGLLHASPQLIIGGESAGLIEGPQPVKTVPSHFSPVYLATDHDIELVFGKEDRDRFFIGNPLDMETKLCLNLPELVKRINGIFGKSGTGKTFLTRLLLIGILQKGQAVNLIFDMHNEYGWSGTREGGPPVKGLKQLFQSRVAVFTLDEESSKNRKVSTDFVARIGYDEIMPEDIVLLKETLNLTDPAAEAAYALRRRLGKNWIKKTLDMEDPNETRAAGDAEIHESTFQNLKRGLATICRLPFIEESVQKPAVNEIISYLDRGINVVLEFGRSQDITAYILVANLLTRRIYDRYREHTEQAMAAGATAPRPLVITIEEAHKFLNPETASQTIFGTIAREMRKYNVTLLVIDQRPSGIDTEVMSQLGTKITCLLDNEHDIDAVLAGVSGKNELKTVLARLASKQQALIFGHAVPMPVAFIPREYGSPESYKSFTSSGDSGSSREQAVKDIDDLWK